VLYVANSPKIGGGIRVVMDLIRNLDQRRFTPLLVAPGNGALVDWASANSIPCELSPDGDWLGAVALARRSAGLVQIIRRHGVSIVHAVAPMAYRALGLAAAITGTPRVCHLGFPPEPGELARSFLAGPDLVIGCYQGQAAEHRDELRRIRPGCRVVGVPNGVDIHRFAPRPAKPDVAAIREGFSTVVAILGHISDVKGHPAFVDAAAIVARRHEGCLFVAIGAENAQPGAMQVIQERVRSAGLGDRFRFLGFRPDVHEVLNAVDIVALPSRSEGLPMALLESMAAARAVIATPVGGVTEALSDGTTGLLVSPDDPAALANAIASLVANPDLRGRLGGQARRRVEARFSIESYVSRVERLYEYLLSPRHESSSGLEAATVTPSQVLTEQRPRAHRAPERGQS
jgi:glycosyltransferase involved in cell wall biosynthesis